MPRRPPEATPPDWLLPSHGRETLALDIEVITPMFGGGYESRSVDPDTVVRAASIRGHLRFWWRALEGARFQTARDLFDAEACLWGGAETYGQVALTVQIRKSGHDRRCEEVAGKPSPKPGPGLGYFLFPFREERGTSTPEAVGRDGVAFSLVATFQATRSEVERAVRAWLAFGGVGARTRRGCGALRGPKEFLPPADEGTLRKWLGSLTEANPSPGIQTTLLHGATVLVGPAPATRDDAMAAWRELATFWAQFRKGHVGGVPYQPKIGGKWEDYEILSSLGGRASGSIQLNKPFLGLPINYKDARFHGTLKPGASDRMASPVVVKPTAFADGSVRPVILVLRAPRPREILVNDQKFDLNPNPTDPVLKSLDSVDPLDAVIAAAKEQWHNRVLLFRIGGSR